MKRHLKLTLSLLALGAIAGAIGATSTGRAWAQSTAQSVQVSFTASNGLTASGTSTFSGKIASTVTSGNPAIDITQGARIRLDSTNNNYCSSDGTNVTCVAGGGSGTWDLTNTGKVAASGLTLSSATYGGTKTLSTGSATQTVASGARCVCTDTTANASVKCSVASTTLTVTGTGSDVIAYICF